MLDASAQLLRANGPERVGDAPVQASRSPPAAVRRLNPNYRVNPGKGSVLHLPGPVPTCDETPGRYGFFSMTAHPALSKSLAVVSLAVLVIGCFSPDEPSVCTDQRAYTASFARLTDSQLRIEIAS